MEIVSHKLAERDTESIREMVTPDVFQQITRNLPTFSDVQCKELAVKGDEMIYSFLHDIVVKKGRFLDFTRHCKYTK